MSFTFRDRFVFTLKEVTNSIQKTLSVRYKRAYWIKAEMNKLNFYSYSGHCYPDLVEKKDGKIIAQLRAIIWKKDFQNINQKFLSTVKEPLKDGINILFLAGIQFDSMHGLSLQILDIDPSYSLGELEKEKDETLNRLRHEKLIHLNKTLDLCLLPKRIAIISVETSKGYADFLKILVNNPYNFKFSPQLFPANLQGEKAVITIRKQLDNIKKNADLFDIVVIVRGGGGDIGLSAFNNYELAKDIARFPLPVFTGIGHATNETVVEMIAHKNAITPTEIANILIQKFQTFAQALQDAEHKIKHAFDKKLEEEKSRFSSQLKYFKSLVSGSLLKHESGLDHLKKNLTTYTGYYIKKTESLQNATQTSLIKAASQNLNKEDIQLNNFKSALEKALQNKWEAENVRIKNIAQKISILDPESILKRGFSITLFNGKSISGHTEVKEGDIIETQFYKNSIKSKVL